MVKEGSEQLPNQRTPRHNGNRMRTRYLVFAFFAAAMLFSIVREQYAPTGCPRLAVRRQDSGHR
jgi:hypothetical protein